jgi:hypothetical protein
MAESAMTDASILLMSQGRRRTGHRSSPAAGVRLTAWPRSINSSSNASPIGRPRAGDRSLPLAVQGTELHFDNEGAVGAGSILSPGYVADTVRAAFGSLGLVKPSNVVPIAATR